MELNLSMKLTHDFKRYGIAFSGPFRVDGTTTVGSYCIHFNVLQNQALSAHDDALGGVLLKKVSLKRLNFLVGQQGTMEGKSRSPNAQMQVGEFLSRQRSKE